jgi:hypothetical protein
LQRMHGTLSEKRNHHEERFYGVSIPRN